MSHTRAKRQPTTGRDLYHTLAKSQPRKGEGTGKSHGTSHRITIPGTRPTQNGTGPVSHPGKKPTPKRGGYRQKPQHKPPHRNAHEYLEFLPCHRLHVRKRRLGKGNWVLVKIPTGVMETKHDQGTKDRHPRQLGPRRTPTTGECSPGMNRQLVHRKLRRHKTTDAIPGDSNVISIHKWCW